jgi:hypothetical protein
VCSLLRRVKCSALVPRGACDGLCSLGSSSAAGGRVSSTVRIVGRRVPAVGGEPAGPRYDHASRPNQRANLCSDTGPAPMAAARAPVPVEAETSTMPADDRSGFTKTRTLDHRAQIRGDAGRSRTSGPLPSPRSAAGPHQQAELVSQRCVLEHQIGATEADGTNDSEKEEEHAIPRPLRLMGLAETAILPPRTRSCRPAEVRVVIAIS